MLSSWGTAGTVLQGSFVQTHPENIHLFHLCSGSLFHLCFKNHWSDGFRRSPQLWAFEFLLFNSTVFRERLFRSRTVKRNIRPPILRSLFWPMASFDAAVRVLT